MSELHTLRAEEYGILTAFPDKFVPNPNSSVAIVALENKEAIARIFLLAPTHVEGPWIREDKRGGTLATRLMTKATEEASARGVTTLFAYAVDKTIENYLARLGFVKVPMTVWAKDIT